MNRLIIKKLLLFTYFCALLAQVVELVDTLDSKSSALRRAGSIPALSTLSFCKRLIYNIVNKAFFYLGRHRGRQILLTSANKCLNTINRTPPY